MAVKATIFKALLQIADVDHELTLARHPSETDERLMVRLLAFARHADPALVFTRGLAEADEPDLWKKDLTGQIELWIEIGQPDEKRILKACGRSDQVVIYTYAPNSATWWNQHSDRLARAKNLSVFQVPAASSRELSRLAQRNMELSCNVSESEITFADEEDQAVRVEIVTLRGATPNRASGHPR